MLLAIITNFAIIFTSSILFYWIIKTFESSRVFSSFTKNVYSVGIGIGFGVIALIITILFLNMSHNVLVNTRFITFILSGLLGGPIAMLANVIFIFFIRFMLGFDTFHSLIISINALCIGLILSGIAVYKPITLKTIHYYFCFLLIEVTIILLYINELTLEALGSIGLFICYSVATYLFLIYVIQSINTVKQNANKSLALTKIDYLTQIPNNLALENQLQSYIDSDTPFEMAHLDVDLFKNFNMQYGYRQGDLLLTQLAQTIQQFAKEHDAYIARITGDEFCYVKPNSAPAQILIEVYELSKIIESTNYEIKNNSVKVTISASIISYPSNASSLTEIFTASNYGLHMITETNTNTIKHINQIKQEHPNY